MCAKLWVLLTVVSYVTGIYVQTEKKAPEYEDIYDYNDQDGLWSELLEQWTLRNGSSREARVLTPNHKYIPTSGFFITKRMGEVAELEPHLRLPGKVITSVPNQYQFKPSQPYNPVQIQPHNPQIPQQMTGHSQMIHQPTQQPAPNPPKQVSETDLYLLNAIEKLVFRVDYMEQRLRRTEQLVYYLMQGNNAKDDNFCPVNFTKVGQNCYHFGTIREINWKSANNMCKSLGGHLAEFETKPEFKEVIKHLLNHAADKGKEFWLGGLNPGLLWIWSNSARPINANTNLTMAASPTVTTTTPTPIAAKNVTESENIQKVPSDKKTKKNKRQTNGYDEIKGTGRCLKMAYNSKKGKYHYLGSDCSSRQFYICEFKDQTLENEISRVSRELKLRT